MAEANTKSAYFIYAGRTADSENHLYYVLNNPQDNDGKTCARLELEPFMLKAKIFKRGSVGAIYPVKLNSEHTNVSFDKNAQPKDYWNTEVDLAEWKLNNDAAKAIAQIQKNGAAVNNILVKQLEQVTRIYKRAKTTQGRAAILAEVIRIITN